MMLNNNIARLKGKALGAKLIDKINKNKPLPIDPIDLTPVINALSKISESKLDVEGALKPLIIAVSNLKRKTIDTEPVVSAIKSLKLINNFNLSSVVKAIEGLEKINLKPIEKELSNIANALKENNNILKQLVDVSKMSKFVEYDNNGRIISIGVK